MSAVRQNAAHAAMSRYYSSREMHTVAPGDAVFYRVRSLLHSIGSRGCPESKLALLEKIIAQQAGNPALQALLEKLR